MVVTRLPDAAALAALLVGLGLDVRAPREGLLSAEVPLFVESLRELPAEYPDQLEGEELVNPS